MRVLLLSLLNFIITLTVAQQVELIHEDFTNGFPSDWKHCSGNSGEFQVWKEDNGALRESEGPYFVRVLNSFQTPALNLGSINNPVLEFDYSLINADPEVRLSIMYSTDSICASEWDNDNIYYFFPNWHEIKNYEATDSSGLMKTISLNLDTLPKDSTVFIRFVADYMTYAT